MPGEEVSTLQANRQQGNQAISPSVQAAVAINNAISESSSTQKPRYKVSAAWSKIQTITAPAYKSPMVSEAQKTELKNKAASTQADTNSSKSLSWKEAWMDWEKEKTDVPAKPVTTLSSKKKSINENFTAAPVLETKYSEPLDLLKDKYIDNILLQKQKSRKGFSFGKGSEFVIPTLALIIIFSIAYWLMHGNNETATALSNSNQKKVETIPSTTANPASLATNNNQPANIVTANNTVDDQKNIPSPIITSNDQAEDRKQNNVETVKLVAQKKNNTESIQNNASTTASKKIIKQPSSKQFDEAVINNVPASKTALNTDAGNPAKHRTYDIDDNSNNSSTQKNTPVITKPVVVKKTTGNYISVPEYVEMKDGSANLKIQNISDVNLDLVVVDVQYFDASNRFRKGETFYLHNLKAGKNVVVKTPKDLSSMYATSKVSLVSSDADNVNVIGDN